MKKILDTYFQLRKYNLTNSSGCEEYIPLNSDLFIIRNFKMWPSEVCCMCSSLRLIRKCFCTGNKL